MELKRPDNVVLRPSQWVWHERDQRGGGKSCVVTCRDKKTWQVFLIWASEQELVRVGDTNQDMPAIVADILGLEL